MLPIPPAPEDSHAAAESSDADVNAAAARLGESKTSIQKPGAESDIAEALKP